MAFSGGSSVTGSGSGGTDVQYHGTAAFGFDNNTGTDYYTVRFTDPEVIVDSAGKGKIVADVSWFVTPSTNGGANDLTVATFTAPAPWTGSTLTATPDWNGVAPADSYGAGKPVSGQSWNPAFVTALPASVQALFYASGSSSDATKAPAAFTAVAPTPSVAVTTTSASYGGGLALSVKGSGFRGVTDPGDDGVYVGIAPAGGLPDVSTMAGQAAFAGAAWVPATQLTTGSFTTALTAPTALLDPTKSYAVYTWQAHSHSNTTQDTVTPLTIDWSKLAPAKAKVTTTWKTKPTTRKAGSLAVTVHGAAGVAKPTGTVKAVLVKGAKKVTVKAKKLAKGKVALPVKKLAKGTWKVTVSYAGDTRYAPATTTVPLKITR